ncbi:nucleoside triphosphate pyrophosphohydrolase [Patescibacteria group bacterium]|nr:nucleoside triphosphate pyrophosphohydrolase [Patescibacteria group bacterium]
METIVYNKLVRDRIPEIITKDRKIPHIRTLEKEEFRRQLGQKLVEEAEEVKAASVEVLADELADILELVRATAEAHGLSMADIETRRVEKRLKRGGFSKRIFLESVDQKS